jgi:hypothetical protein
MVFSEDAILLSFFSRYEGEEDDLKEAIIKYCSGGTLEANRPGVIDSTKGDITDLDQVGIKIPIYQKSMIIKNTHHLTNIGNEPN